jgi:hypothetical protein
MVMSMSILYYELSPRDYKSRNTLDLTLRRYSENMDPLFDIVSLFLSGMRHGTARALHVQLCSE